MARICWERSKSCFIYGFVIQVISKKHCVAKVLLAIWQIFLHENNPNSGSDKFSCKFAFIHFLFLLRNQEETKNKNHVCSKLVVWQREIFLLFFYSESCSTSKPWRIQYTFIKEFSYMLILFYICGNKNSDTISRRYWIRFVLVVLKHDLLPLTYFTLQFP